ncbi:formate dehydrogenase accessory protein FdhE [Ensifer sp.]|uniref:formate dehydrogenase accessory protein FdhE n=1 Tax=Ensifer sp. TaxID=1872086 RepID=UPI000DD72925|nr:formate dehydrogenase accessory protein FdhE [Ensifer sp.]
MAEDIHPDPSLIGGVPTPPIAFLPEPIKLFQTRARRFAFLAESNALAPYLTFLAALSKLQARLAATLPPVAAPAPMPIARARAAMPPIDRAARAGDPELGATLAALLEGAVEIVMPEPARLALDAVRAANDDDRQWLLSNILSDQIPDDSAAPHLFVAAAVQVHMARLAAMLDAQTLVPVGFGLCPACGGRPATSSVMGAQGIENIRYAACACCGTQWNEVRVKCLCCGSTKGVSYRSVETTEATVKAEACRECHAWVKIFYQVKNPSLDPIADDVGSLGLDILMKETEFRRGGFNPYLAGY